MIARLLGGTVPHSPPASRESLPVSNATPTAALPQLTARPPHRARRSSAAAHRLLALLAAAAGHPALCGWHGPHPLVLTQRTPGTHGNFAPDERACGMRQPQPHTPIRRPSPVPTQGEAG